MRFLMDEHMLPSYRKQLMRRVPDLRVWAIGDPGAPPFSTPDPQILDWCEEHNFLLVTNNRASMPPHLADHLAQGKHIPGILIVNLDAGIGAMIEELALIAGASYEGEYRDMIAYLPTT